jgi:beta-lactamase regulating signal transducer with metallopeptidase domain
MMNTASQIVITFLSNALWQIALIALAITLCEKLGRRRFLPASSRHLFWVVALILSVGLPLLSLRYASGSGELYFISTRTGGLLANAPRTLSALGTWLFRFIAERPRPIFMSGQITRIIFYSYVIFLIYRSAHFCVVCLRTRIIRRTAVARPVPKTFTVLMQRTRRGLGVFQEPALRVSRQDGPMTCGARNPVIIVPEALLEETSHTVIISVLGHELAHVRRHDFLLNLIYEFLFLPISFHPAAWFIRRRIDQTRELACDEMVACPLLDPPSYVQSLFSVIRSLSVSRGHSCGLGTADTRQLEERFKAILSLKPRNRAASCVLFASSIVLGIVSIAAASFPMTFVP